MFDLKNFNKWIIKITKKFISIIFKKNITNSKYLKNNEKRTSKLCKNLLRGKRTDLRNSY
jgi:hypothetical protein